MKESPTTEQELALPPVGERRGRAQSGMQRREHGDLGAFEPGAALTENVEASPIPEDLPAPEVRTDPDAFTEWTAEELAALEQKLATNPASDEDETEGSRRVETPEQTAARIAYEEREAAWLASAEAARLAREVARAPEVAAISARVQKLRDQQERLRAYIQKVSARVTAVPTKPGTKAYQRSEDEVIGWYEKHQDEKRLVHNAQIIKARRQIARLQKEIDALVAQPVVEERRRIAIKDAAKKWTDEKARLEDIIRKTTVADTVQNTQSLPPLTYKAADAAPPESQTNPSSYFYGIHNEAVDRLKVVDRKIQALQGRYEWRKNTNTPPGRLPPTSHALRTAVYNNEARQSQQHGEGTNERRPGKVFGDLFEYYNDAVRTALDPQATREDKIRARSEFAYVAHRVERAIDRLPMTTSRQEERKRELTVLIKPFLIDVNEEFEWTNRRLLPVYDALNRCYEAREQILSARTPDTIEAFRKAVIQFESTFQRCKAETMGSTDEEDELLKEALSATTPNPAKPQVFYKFKTVSDPTQPFNLVEPLPYKNYVKGMDINVNLDRFDDLRSLPDPKAMYDEEQSAVEAHARRVGSVKKQLQGLEDVVRVFKAAARFETENLIYKSQPKAIGAKPEFTLDDIAKLREEKDTSPSSTSGLKSVAELKRETRAYAEERAKEERLATTQDVLCERLGVTPERLLRLPAFWIGRRVREAVRNFWHRRVLKTKNYVSTQDLLAEYRKLRAENETKLEPEEEKAKKAELTQTVTAEVTTEIAATRALTSTQERCEAEMQVLRSIDSTHGEKLTAIAHYQQAQKQYTEQRPHVPSYHPIVLSLARTLRDFERDVKAYQDRVRSAAASSVEALAKSPDAAPSVVRLREYSETLPILTYEWETQVPARFAQTYTEVRQRLSALAPEERLDESDYLHLQTALHREPAENAEKILEKNKRILLTLPPAVRSDYYLSLLIQRKIAALGEVHELEYQFRQLPRTQQTGRSEARFKADQKKLYQIAFAEIGRTKGNKELLAA